MFLNYVVVCNSLAAYDYMVGIPVRNTALFLVDLCIAGIFLFIVLFLYLRNVRINKGTSTENSR